MTKKVPNIYLLSELSRLTGELSVPFPGLRSRDARRTHSNYNNNNNLKCKRHGTKQKISRIYFRSTHFAFKLFLELLLRNFIAGRI